jgi:hypothetical protein
VISHELGHVAGLDHTASGVMAEQLGAGVRIMPAASRAVVPSYAYGAYAGVPASAADTSAPSGPVAIDWGVTVTSRDSAPAKKAVPALPASWQRDFVSYLGQTEKQRNPNLGLRLHVDANGKIAPSLTSL